MCLYRSCPLAKFASLWWNLLLGSRVWLYVWCNWTSLTLTGRPCCLLEGGQERPQRQLSKSTISELTGGFNFRQPVPTSWEPIMGQWSSAWRSTFWAVLTVDAGTTQLTCSMLRISTKVGQPYLAWIEQGATWPPAFTTGTYGHSVAWMIEISDYKSSRGFCFEIYTFPYVVSRLTLWFWKCADTTWQETSGTSCHLCGCPGVMLVLSFTTVACTSVAATMASTSTTALSTLMKFWGCGFSRHPCNSGGPAWQASLIVDIWRSSAGLMGKTAQARLNTSTTQTWLGSACRTWLYRGWCLLVVIVDLCYCQQKRRIMIHLGIQRPDPMSRNWRHHEKVSVETK